MEAGLGTVSDQRRLHSVLGFVPRQGGCLALGRDLDLNGLGKEADFAEIDSNPIMPRVGGLKIANDECGFLGVVQLLIVQEPP